MRMVAEELLTCARLLLGALPNRAVRMGENILFGSSKWPSVLVTVVGDKYRVWQFNSRKEAEKKLGSLDISSFVDTVQIYGGLRFDKESLMMFSQDEREKNSMIKRTLDHGVRFSTLRGMRNSGWSPTATEKDILIKSANDFTKVGLYDFIVGKHKLTPGFFEQLFGPVDVSGSERISVVRHNKWEIHIDKSATFSPDDVYGLLDKAESILTRFGFGNLAYGQLMLLGTLKGSTLASYMESSDAMRMRTKGLRVTRDAVKDLLHELGHRNWYKFFKKKKEVATEFFRLNLRKPMPRELGVAVGDILVHEGDRYVVLNLGSDGVSVEQTAAASSRQQKRIGKRFKISSGTLASDSIVIEGKEKNKVDWSSFFPTSYSTSSAIEWYAELFSWWLSGGLREPAVSWMESLHK